MTVPKSSQPDTPPPHPAPPPSAPRPAAAAAAPPPPPAGGTVAAAAARQWAKKRQEALRRADEIREVRRAAAAARAARAASARDEASAVVVVTPPARVEAAPRRDEEGGAAHGEACACAECEWLCSLRSAAPATPEVARRRRSSAETLPTAAPRPASGRGRMTTRAMAARGKGSECASPRTASTHRASDSGRADDGVAGGVEAASAGKRDTGRKRRKQWSVLSPGELVLPYVAGTPEGEFEGGASVPRYGRAAPEEEEEEEEEGGESEWEDGEAADEDSFEGEEVGAEGEEEEEDGEEEEGEEWEDAEEGEEDGEKAAPDAVDAMGDGEAGGWPEGHEAAAEELAAADGSPHAHEAAEDAREQTPCGPATPPRPPSAPPPPPPAADSPPRLVPPTPPPRPRAPAAFAVPSPSPLPPPSSSPAPPPSPSPRAAPRTPVGKLGKPKPPRPPQREEGERVFRQMVDKRQCRRVNRQPFSGAIAAWRAAADGAKGGGRQPLEPLDRPARPRVRVIVRCRPLFAAEERRGDFDVVTVRRPRAVVVHRCCMRPDLKRMFIEHVSFGVGEAYGAAASTEEVCGGGVGELLRHVRGGGCATLFMYGQTGSGKTYTMAGIERLAAAALLPDAPAGAPPLGHLSCFEIAGSRCVDLLAERAGVELPLKPDASGRTAPAGAARAEVRSAAELLAALSLAKARRATSATGANAESSRSHAVCELVLRGCGARPPMLTLVDCAGSERKEDNDAHTAAQRKEGAEINESLFALKECMRQWVAAQEGKAGVHVPFRMSALTRVLADSFTRRDTQMAVVGTVSPSCNDTEHSIHTLKTVAMLAGAEGAIKEAKQEVKRVVAPPPMHMVPPKLWDEARVRKWVAEAKDGLLTPLLDVLPAGMSGKGLMRMTVKQMETMWAASPELANAVFNELRVETTRAEAATRKARLGQRDAEQRHRAGIVG
ncbi:hypothetical protein AB1Y20_015869 [Prymnesium parvum]|uniref:Kinesin motor domain-containing protein n=1 Tax=Prymnesium parvum TaxID=97485 RepID=A0AB34JZ37_PRYPA